MELNIYILKEIMKVDIEADNQMTKLNSFIMMQKYANCNLINDENNNLFYQVEVDEILQKQVDPSVLITLRQSGWEMTQDDKHLIFKLD